MADNVLLNAGSGGDTIAADDDGTAKHQYVKVEFGANDTQTPVDATNPLPVAPMGASVDSSNSSTTPLGISAAFTGTSTDVTQYGSISVQVFADVASATDGLSLEFSTDGTNWDVQDQHTIAANTAEIFILPRGGQFFRVVYTNGGTGQATFRLETILNPWAVSGEVEELDVALDSKDLALTTRAVIAGENPGGDYTNVQVSTAGNFKIDVEELAGNAVSLNAGNVDAGTQRVVLATDQASVAIDDNSGSLTVDAPVGTPVNVQIGDGTDTVVVSAAGGLSAEVTTALPTGANVIGNVGLEAGTNNIGDVDIASFPASALEVVGDAAENAAAAGNPVLTGGRYDLTPRTLGDGDVGAFALDPDGAVHVSDGGNTLTVDGTVTADAGTGPWPVTDNAGSLTVDAPVATPVNVQIGDGTETALVSAGGALSVEATVALPAGSNVIGNVGLEAGTNNIGDVDIASFPASALEVVGDVAHDAAAAGNPVLVAARANSDEPATAVAAGDSTYLWADTFGRLITLPGHPNPVAPVYINATASGDTAVIAAPGAGVSLYIVRVAIVNGAASVVNAQLQENGTATNRGPGDLAADGGGIVMDFGPRGWKLTANTGLDINLGATGDVHVTVLEHYIAA